MKSRIEIKRMIESNPMNALDYLIDNLDEDANREFFNTAIVIKSDLVKTNKMQTLGLISFEENRRRQTQVNVNIIDIIDRIPDEFFSLSQSSLKYIPINEGYLHVASLIRKLANIKIEYTTAKDEFAKGFYTGKRHLIATQAASLVERNNIEVSSLEYMTIAEAFHLSVDNIKAEELFKKAILNINEYSDSALIKIVIIRSYANFLYQINRPHDGANQYETAILKNLSSEANILNGYTYQMKFRNDSEIHDFDTAVESYEKAKEFYLKIDNKSIQRHNIKNLEKAWDSFQMPHNLSRP